MSIPVIAEGIERTLLEKNDGTDYIEQEFTAENEEFRISIKFLITRFSGMARCQITAKKSGAAGSRELCTIPPAFRPVIYGWTAEYQFRGTLSFTSDGNIFINVTSSFSSGDTFYYYYAFTPFYRLVDEYLKTS